MILETIHKGLWKAIPTIENLMYLRAKIFFNFLKRSRIFWHWYEHHLNELAYDLDISQHRGTKKTLEKYYTNQLNKLIGR